MTATPPDTFTPVAPPDASVLAQALGLPLYAPDWHMPQYPEGAVGPWRMRRTGVGLDCGYYSGTCISAGSTVLLRQGSEGQWDTWMSLSPMEIESQELACRHARGHTVVMGLGMGWVAANVALQPAVALSPSLSGTVMYLSCSSAAGCWKGSRSSPRGRSNWCNPMRCSGNRAGPSIFCMPTSGSSWQNHRRWRTCSGCKPMSTRPRCTFGARK